MPPYRPCLPTRHKQQAALFACALWLAERPERTTADRGALAQQRNHARCAIFRRVNATFIRVELGVLMSSRRLVREWELKPPCEARARALVSWRLRIRSPRLALSWRSSNGAPIDPREPENESAPLACRPLFVRFANRFTVSPTEFASLRMSWHFAIKSCCVIITRHTAHRTFFEAPVTSAPACGLAASQADLPIPPHVSPFPPPRCTPSPLSASGHHHRTHIRLTPH